MMIKNVKDFCVKTQYLLGRHLQLQKNGMMNKNNGDLQLLFITLFCSLSDALGNNHIKFSHFCFYTTKLLSPVLLAFQFPIKNRMCCVRQTIYSKKPQQKFFLQLCCFINFE